MLDEEQYKSMFEEIALTLGGLPQEAVDTQLGLFDLRQELGQTGDMEAYIGLIQDFGVEAGVLDARVRGLIINLDKLARMPIPEVYFGDDVGYQHGGSFTVRGPSGPDRVPVGFMATAGEQVTITPAGQTDNSRSVHIENLNVQGGGQGIETQMAMEDSVLRVLEGIL